MSFYDQYPMMRPYVGKQFRAAGMPSLLLIGESHYLPRDSVQHLDSDTWYSSDSATLASTEVEWISTADILENARADGFSSNAQCIWRNALREINEHGPRYADYRRMADHIASYNFFLRPGLEGASLAVTTQDAELANKAFRAHYESLQPTAVSKKYGNKGGRDVLAEFVGTLNWAEG
jgi:hypothetical protein